MILGQGYRYHYEFLDWGSSYVQALAAATSAADPSSWQTPSSTISPPIYLKWQASQCAANTYALRVRSGRCRRPDWARALGAHARGKQRRAPSGRTEQPRVV